MLTAAIGALKLENLRIICNVCGVLKLLVASSHNVDSAILSFCDEIVLSLALFKSQNRKCCILMISSLTSRYLFKQDRLCIRFIATVAISLSDWRHRTAAGKTFAVTICTNDPRQLAGLFARQRAGKLVSISTTLTDYLHIDRVDATID